MFQFTTHKYKLFTNSINQSQPYMMTILRIYVLFVFVCEVYLQQIDKTVDLLDEDVYTWDGKNLGSTTLQVSAKNYTIKATIETCDIGELTGGTNQEYLIFKNGIEDDIYIQNGLRFAHIKKPKKLFIYTSLVVLELKASQPLTKTCKVIFEKADVQEPTLPPPTTTEIYPTIEPDVSIYSTVLISGKTINQIKQNKDLVAQLKASIADMANEYTKENGFCLKDQESIEKKNIHIKTLEQCPATWPEFESCLRMVYALPIVIDESCSRWSGYQLTKEHLDLMWTRLANKYLKDGFSVYTKNNLKSTIGWSIAITLSVSVLIICVIITSIVIWKLKSSKRSEEDEDFSSMRRKQSDISLTPPYFQSTPPMFDNTYTQSTGEYPEGKDNKGFQYDEIPVSEEEASII